MIRSLGFFAALLLSGSFIVASERNNDSIKYSLFDAWYRTGLVGTQSKVVDAAPMQRCLVYATGLTVGVIGAFMMPGIAHLVPLSFRVKSAIMLSSTIVAISTILRRTTSVIYNFNNCKIRGVSQAEYIRKDGPLIAKSFCRYFALPALVVGAGFALVGFAANKYGPKLV